MVWDSGNILSWINLKIKTHYLLGFRL
jgi:hypothetical protein